MKTNEKYENIEFMDLSFGVNKERNVEDIADNEVVEAINFFVNESNQLQTRFGVSKLNQSPSSFDSPITSMFGFSFGATENQQLIVTSGNKLYVEDDQETYVDITNSLSFPNKSYWCFTQFQGLVICSNGSTSGSGYVSTAKYDGSTLTKLTDGEDENLKDAPASKFCCVFGERLFLVSADKPNLIHYSKLGDPENFLSGGGQLEVGLNDGDYITGIYPFRGSLFIFKSRKIYVLLTGQPSTDDNQWSVDLYSDKIGCLSHFTIQAVLDDVFFLSSFGISSLKASDIAGSYKLAILSNKIPDLTTYLIDNNSLAKPVATINSRNNEYWLSVPSSTSKLRNGRVIVVNFSRYAENQLAFTEFTGLIAGYSLYEIKKDNKNYIYIGGESLIYYYDFQSFNDNGSNFTKQLKTKKINFSSKNNRKEFNNVGVRIKNNLNKTSDFSIDTFRYYVDENYEDFNLEFTETITGSVWDEVSPAIGTWALKTKGTIIFNTRLCNPSVGKRGITLQFEIIDNQASNFTIECFSTFVALITSKKSNTV